MRHIAWFLLDVILKTTLGVAIVLLIWLPFGFFGDYSLRPWIIAGFVLGGILNGLWELSDVFGLKRLLGIRD